MEPTPGRKFYQDQIAMLQQKGTDELISKHYHDSAVLISFAKIVRGRDEIKQHFRVYMETLGHLEITSLDQFTECEDATFFEAKARAALGESRVYDACVLRDGKVTHHFTGLK